MTRHAELVSQLYHFLFFLMKMPREQFEKALLIISIDIDVGNKELGVLNKGRNDRNVSRHLGEYLIGEIEEKAVPLFVELFDSFEIPVTFAIRGQLMEIDASIFDLVRKSSIKHDIGAHGYYHRSFADLSRIDAEIELEKTREAMRNLGIIPKSFVFPKNRVAHLSLLEEQGYKCYRGSGKRQGPFLNDTMHIEKRGSLFNICPSLHFTRGENSKLLERILDISVTRKLPFHIWFHLWDFGVADRAIRRTINEVFVPLLQYAKKKERSDLLTFETMLSATKKAEKNFETPMHLQALLEGRQ